MDLLSLTEQMTGMERSPITFLPNRCLHAHVRSARCDACFQVCPVGAIQPGQPTPQFNLESCVLCRACCSICPVSAFSAEDSAYALLKCFVRANVQSLQIFCEHHPASHALSTEFGGAVRVRGCLAGLGAGTYLSLVALGAEQVSLRLDACQDCSWGHLQAFIQSQITEASRLLQPWCFEARILSWMYMTEGEHVEHPIWDVYNPPMSRRDLFKLAVLQERLGEARALVETSMEEDLHLSRDRLRVTASLRHLLKNHPMSNEMILNDLGFAVLAIDDSCTACGACSRICPTNALQFHADEEDRSYQLEFYPDRCIACGICLRSCTTHSICIQLSPSFQEVFIPRGSRILREGKLIRCKSCKAWISAQPGEELCPSCQRRRDGMYGSMKALNWRPDSTPHQKSSDQDE